MNQRSNSKISVRTFPILATLMVIVVLLMLSTFVARSAYADTVTLLPDGDVLPGSWTPLVGPLLSDDVNAGGGGAGDATYATITGTQDTFTVSMAGNAAYSGSTINSVRVYVRAAVIGGGGAGERITFGSTSPVLSTSGTTTLTDNTPTDAFFDLVGIANSGEVDALEISVDTTTLGAGEEARIYDIWVDVTYTPLAAANELNACDSCHQQPPVEDTSRNLTEGAVVGSHTKHAAYSCTVCHPNNAVLNHRGGLGVSGTEGKIDMLANIQGGTYALGSAGFAQDNEDGTGLGTCSDISCHGGAATTTPQWGSGSLGCDSCHGAPPTTNGDIHGTHYTAKGWGATDVSGTYCSQCHPDNTTTHSDVTDSTVVVTLAPSGVSPAISCGSAPALGCHNGKATPNWNTTGITCQQCHTAGGAGPADPTSGLHDETPVVSGIQHNPADPNFTGCEDCHTATPSDNHWDGTAQTSAPIINFDAGATGFVDGTPPTCTSSCHNDSPTSGPWARKWHENSDLDTGDQCAGCHGDWVSGWNGGVTHRTDSGAGSTRQTHNAGTDYECQDCHGLGAKSTNTGYTFTSVTNDWGGTSNHGNAFITMNDNGTAWARSVGLSGCNPCHPAFDGTDGALGQNSFSQTGWTPDFVTGEVINAGCDTCHGGGGDYWPKGAAYPDTAGRHQIHITRLAAELGFALPGSDAQQKQMCDYCHNDPAGAGGGGHDDSGTPAAPSDVGAFNQIWDAAADTGSAYVADGCNSIACHNNNDTGTTTYGWNDAGTSTCLMCHTEGGNGGAEIADPTSGLHDVTPTISGQRHGNAMGCVNCHTSTPSADHIGGTAGTPNFAGTVGFNGAPTPPTCANNCHADSSTWERKWHENSTATNGNECAGCHGTFATGFVTGMGARHQTNTTGDADGDIETKHDGTDKCFTCHLYKDGDTTYYDIGTDHRDNNIQLNNQNSFTDNGATVGCGACHSANDGTADEAHEFADTTSRWTRQLVAGPAPSCTGCHSAHGTGSAGVGPDSPHSNNVTGLTCEGCHTGHGNAGDVLIPNNAAVGINYSANGETGISLGGAGTTGTTEAQICWNCHVGSGVTEWNVNTDTNGAGANYDHGSLNQSNWVGATWTSAQAGFSYKTAAIQSTHAANSGSGVSGVDAVGNIRCSYCHDVHDTQGPTGKPYLRGTWMGNPYLEDGAPRNGMSYTSYFGNVPRGAAINTYGGYQIDQNNGNPTSGWTADGSSQLCEMCHGNNDGTWSANEVNTLNQFGTASNDWVGTNGHANAVLGGDGTGRANIFRTSDRTANIDTNGAQPDMGYVNHGGSVGYGFRGTDGRSFRIAPGITGNSRPYGGNNYVWNATVDNGTIDLQYHQFSCSKCHNPHASRLPRLMITNCLDTKQNTWDENAGAGGVTGSTSNNNGVTISAGTSPDSYGKTWSNVASAQNCHRVGDSTQSGTGTGWNNVTPW